MEGPSSEIETTDATDAVSGTGEKRPSRRTHLSRDDQHSATRWRVSSRRILLRLALENYKELLLNGYHSLLFRPCDNTDSCAGMPGTRRTMGRPAAYCGSNRVGTRVLHCSTRFRPAADAASFGDGIAEAGAAMPRTTPRTTPSTTPRAGDRRPPAVRAGRRGQDLPARHLQCGGMRGAHLERQAAIRAFIDQGIGRPAASRAARPRSRSGSPTGRRCHA
jgi:hypothetical protein